MDISTPLLSGFPMDREQLPVLWIPLKYEKLGNFCYGCGRLGHEQRDCLVSEVQKLIKEGVDMGLFGRWLRADNPDYHLGINKQLLLEAERAKCSTEIRSLIGRAGDSVGDMHSTPQCEKAKDNSGQKKVQLPIDMWNALVNDKEREKVHLEDTMPANDDPSSRDPANTATGHDVQQNLITKSAVKHTLPENECLGPNHPVILQPKLTLPNDNPTIHSIQSSKPQHKVYSPQDELNQPNNFPSNIIAQTNNQPKRKVIPVDSNIQNPKKQKISPQPLIYQAKIQYPLLIFQPTLVQTDQIAE
jgi:hypothetical protein